MKHRFEYKGNHYTVEVFEGRNGGWTWSSPLESEPIRKCDDLPLDSQDAALSEAKRKVKWMIDHRK